MASLSFTEYLKSRRVTDTPAGDFIIDAKSDPTMPDATSWKQLEFYLTTKGAIPDAVTAAKIVWKGYLAQVRRDSSAKRP
jgi:YozE SAM-like fold